VFERTGYTEWRLVMKVVVVIVLRRCVRGGVAVVPQTPPPWTESKLRCRLFPADFDHSSSSIPTTKRSCFDPANKRAITLH
jgi:hypothetical protein